MIGKGFLPQKFLRKKPSTGKVKTNSNTVLERIGPLDCILQRKRQRRDFNIMDETTGVKRTQKRGDFNTVDERVDTVDWISQLPEPIIHHILSLLHRKDAARTSILSKKWRCMWTSFFVLDFDQKNFERKWCDSSEKQCLEIRKREEFRNFIDYSLQTRLEQPFSIKKFRLHMTSYDLELAPHMDRWIDFATKSNIKELDLHVPVKKKKCYSLPQTVLTAKTITALRLYGCKLEPNSDIKLFHLQKLCLKKLHVDERMIQNLVFSCPLIEDLRLVDCSGLKILHVSTLLKLTRVDVHLCHRLETVEIEAPNLQTFWYYGKQSMPCKINLAYCETLRRLTLKDANMTDELFQCQISNFPFLEDLVLTECNVLESIKISSQQLKRLALRECKKLAEVEIDTPNLLAFEYKGDKMPFSSMDASSLQEAKLCFEPIQRAKLEFCLGDHDAIWFTKLREFLGKFSHSKGLKLVICSKKNVIIHEDLREILLPPLYDLKLEIIKSSTSFEDLVDGLLQTWHPETLSVVSSSCLKINKFIYEKIMDREENPSCCRYYSKKCWRHDLKDVTLGNFEGAEDKRTSDWNAWLKSCPTLLYQTISFRLKWKSDDEDGN